MPDFEALLNSIDAWMATKEINGYYRNALGELLPLLYAIDQSAENEAEYSKENKYPNLELDLKSCLERIESIHVAVVQKKANPASFFSFGAKTDMVPLHKLLKQNQANTVTTHEAAFKLSAENILPKLRYNEKFNEFLIRLHEGIFKEYLFIKKLNARSELLTQVTQKAVEDGLDGRLEAFIIHEDTKGAEGTKDFARSFAGKDLRKSILFNGKTIAEHLEEHAKIFDEQNLDSYLSKEAALGTFDDKLRYLCTYSVSAEDASNFIEDIFLPQLFQTNSLQYPLETKFLKLIGVQELVGQVVSGITDKFFNKSDVWRQTAPLSQRLSYNTNIVNNAGMIQYHIDCHLDALLVDTGKVLVKDKATDSLVEIEFDEYNVRLKADEKFEPIARFRYSVTPTEVKGSDGKQGVKPIFTDFHCELFVSDFDKNLQEALQYGSPDEKMTASDEDKGEVGEPESPSPPSKLGHK